MKLFLTLSVAALLSFHTQAQVYSLLCAPELPLSGIHKIAILDFQGEGGRLVVDKLTQQLMDDKRKGASRMKGLFAEVKTGRPPLQANAHAAVFSIAERSQLEKILQEQRLSSSGVVDDSQAAELGKLLGIDGMILGAVNFTETTVNAMNQAGVTQRKKTVKTSLTMKVIRVTTAEILGIKTFENTQESMGTESSLKATAVMVDASISGFMIPAANWISPYFATYELPVQKIKVKEFADKAKIARELVEEKGDLKQAFAIYKEMYDTDPYCAEAVYNMGAIVGGHGNYQQALEYFQKAAEIDNDTYATYVKWAQDKLAELPLLAQLGVDPGTVEFTDAKPAAIMPKAKTRGAKADRYKVYVRPDASSEVAAQVPGSTEFEIIENKGAWVLIKLIGGKEGYISSDDVKL